MRPTDRFFEIIQTLRDGKLHKATDLAERLEVSVRTIYRDIDSLVASGIPIEGARGLGYILRAPVFLPPLAFSQTEMEALHLGAALVQQTADPELQQAAARLIDKVDQVMPPGRAPVDRDWGMAVYGAPEVQASFAFMPAIRLAVREKRVLQISYRRQDGAPSDRRIRPLQLEYWGRVWTCTAWCELRDGFRVFRVDRLVSVTDTRQNFEDAPGKRLRDYLEQIGYGE